MSKESPAEPLAHQHCIEGAWPDAASWFTEIPWATGSQRLSGLTPGCWPSLVRKKGVQCTLKCSWRGSTRQTEVRPFWQQWVHCRRPLLVRRVGPQGAYQDGGSFRYYKDKDTQRITKGSDSPSSLLCTGTEQNRLFRSFRLKKEKSDKEESPIQPLVPLLPWNFLHAVLTFILKVSKDTHNITSLIKAQTGRFSPLQRKWFSSGSLTPQRLDTLNSRLETARKWERRGFRHGPPKNVRETRKWRNEYRKDGLRDRPCSASPSMVHFRSWDSSSQRPVHLRRSHTEVLKL